MKKHLLLHLLCKLGNVVGFVNKGELIKIRNFLCLFLETPTFYTSFVVICRDGNVKSMKDTKYRLRSEKKFKICCTLLLLLTVW